MSIKAMAPIPADTQAFPMHRSAMSRLWSTYTAAPHRVMFLPGILQGVLVMLWWILDLEMRRSGGAGLASGGLPAPALHVWWMVYGFFPFFVFGFLFTAAPNWLNGPAIPRPAYIASGVLMALGVVLVHAGMWLPGLALVGLAVHLVGWCVAVWALFRTLSRAPPQDKHHTAVATVAALLGAVGNAAFLAWAGLDMAEGLAVAEMFGLWGFLAPTFLAVCHRMIPWFTSRIVPNYVMIRPYGPLWVVLAGCLGHGFLEIVGRPELTWPLDLLNAAIVFWFAVSWGVARGARQARLLAMLHIAFLWSGVAFVLYGLGSLAGFAGLSWSAGQAPVHALGIGFFSTMLIGMASRVSLGHSGRKLEADAATWGLVWLVQGMAITRMLPDLIPALPDWLITLAGLLWLLAFGLWAWKYAPMYWRPRVDGKPG
jgi:uncharacterized protein involved in response to NO